MERTERRKFTVDFKLEVIKYAEETSGRGACRHFNIDSKTVRTWRKQKSKLELLLSNDCGDRVRVTDKAVRNCPAEVGPLITHEGETHTEGDDQNDTFEQLKPTQPLQGVKGETNSTWEMEPKIHEDDQNEIYQDIKQHKGSNFGDLYRKGQEHCANCTDFLQIDKISNLKIHDPFKEVEKFIPVMDALSSIFQIEWSMFYKQVQENYRHKHITKENCEVLLCKNCASILDDMYSAYCQFNKLAKWNSLIQLAKFYKEQSQQANKPMHKRKKLHVSESEVSEDEFVSETKDDQLFEEFNFEESSQTSDEEEMKFRDPDDITSLANGAESKFNNPLSEQQENDSPVQQNIIDKTKKHKGYTVQTKLLAIEYAENFSQSKAAKKFNVDRKSIREWMKQKEKLRIAAINNSSRRRLTKGPNSKRKSYYRPKSNSDDSTSIVDLKSEVYECHICGETFIRKTQLDIHSRKHRPPKDREKTKDRTIPLSSMWEDI